MGQPKILHVIDTTGPGGAEVVFIELADRLRHEGYRSLALIRGSGWVADTLVDRGIEHTIIPAKGSFNLRYLLNLICLIRKERISLIQAHLLGSSVYCALGGLLTGVPVVATFHGMVDVGARERFLCLKRQAMRAGVTRFVAVSTALASALSKQRIIVRKYCSVIFNGIDTARFVNQRNGWLHKQLKLPADSLLAVSIGNIRPAKDYGNLCRAAAILKSDHPSLHFIIAGAAKSPLIEELTSLCIELNVHDRVHFIGFQADPAKVLSEGSLFILSSSSEGFSISTIEALATGLPAVVTACGGPEEIIRSDETALLVPPRDHHALAKSISLLVANPGLREQFRINGQRYCREAFDIRKMVTEYRKLYRQIISEETQHK